jgi:hypothetical protein
MEKGYSNDMYGSGDFDQMKNKLHCSICHGEGHIMNRHKQGLKRNPRVRAAAGTSHRSGYTGSPFLLPPVLTSSPPQPSAAAPRNTRDHSAAASLPYTNHVAHILTQKT